MSIRAGAAGLALALAAPASGAALVQASTEPGRAAAATAVGVSEREFSITPYRTRVPPGEVRFNVTNFGEDAHNLVVRSPGGRTLASSPTIRGGARETLTARLRRPGVYRLLCTAADHHRRGMRARLRVTD